MASNIENLTRECMLRDLQQIRRKLSELSDCNFMPYCSEWVARRRKTLSVLNELQRELDAIHINTGIARAVGSGVGVLGGLAAIIGFGLRLGGMEELGDELCKYGTGAGITGGAVAGIADVAGNMLSNNVICKLSTALREEEWYMSRFKDWFQRSQALEDLIQRVFGCSFPSDTFNDILEFAEKSKVVYDQSGQLVIQTVNCLSDFDDKIFARGLDSKHMTELLRMAKDKTKFLLEEFCNDKYVREAVWSICQVVRRSPIVFEIAKIGTGIYHKIGPHNLVTLALMHLDEPLKQAVSRIFDGWFLAIKLAISVAALISAARDIKEGKSKYTKMLNDVKMCLSCEMKILLEEYPDLK